MSDLFHPLPTDWTQYDVMKPDDLNAVCGAVNALQRENEALRAALSDKAAAGAPPKYDLPLSSNVVKYAECSYHINDFNEVTVILSAAPADGYTVPTGGALLATLPPGFRPKEYFECPAALSVNYGIQAATIMIYPNGNIMVFHYQTERVKVIHLGSQTFAAQE